MNTERNKGNFALQPAEIQRGRVINGVLTTIATIAIFCVTSVALHASEMSSTPQSTDAWTWDSAFWLFSIPVAVAVLFSLMVNRREGWGWIVVGSAIVVVLLVLQILWSIVTSFRGDPGDDEDYFKPLDSWTSDSF